MSVVAPKMSCKTWSLWNYVVIIITDLRKLRTPIGERGFGRIRNCRMHHNRCESGVPQFSNIFQGLGFCNVRIVESYRCSQNNRNWKNVYTYIHGGTRGGNGGIRYFPLSMFSHFQCFLLRDAKLWNYMKIRYDRNPEAPVWIWWTPLKKTVSKVYMSVPFHSCRCIKIASWHLLTYRPEMRICESMSPVFESSDRCDARFWKCAIMMWQSIRIFFHFRNLKSNRACVFRRDPSKMAM